MVLSPKVSSGNYQLVVDLINPDLKTWKVNTLNALFEAHEVALIQSILVSNGGKEDKLVWSPTKNGIFSIRSAHHLH